MPCARSFRIEINRGADEKGSYSYTLFWAADYHPAHPLGENRVAERGQCRFGPLPLTLRDGTVADALDKEA